MHLIVVQTIVNFSELPDLFFSPFPTLFAGLIQVSSIINWTKTSILVLKSTSKGFFPQLGFLCCAQAQDVRVSQQSV